MRVHKALNPQLLTTQHLVFGREISDSLLDVNTTSMIKVCASSQRHATWPTRPRSHTRRRRDLAPQPPCSRLRDRAQDEQPTLQAGASHTGAHDAHNSHRAVPLEPHRVPQEPVQ
eukprot:scaffold42743_cov68-Phaeocystis_antarctica.AAC.2